jgi:DUF917 family protein
MAWMLDLPDLPPLALGALLLGSGGGGDPTVGRLLAAVAIAESGPVTVIGVDEVPDDALVIPTSTMGAPTVLSEKLPNGREGALALRRLEERLGRTAFATLPAEIGGVNALIPVAVAARCRIPLVDADGMGRAFPGLDQETFHVAGVRATPAAMANEHGDVIVFDRLHDDHAYERLARRLVPEMGGHAFLADFPMTGAELRRAAVPGTVSQALRLGRALEAARRASADALAALAEALAGGVYGPLRPVAVGKVVDVVRAAERGAATIDGIGPDQGRVVRLDFQNEYHVATRDGEVVARVPDIIVVLDLEAQLPLPADRLRYGQRVVVAVVGAPAALRTEAALAVFGPRAFGYELP